MGVYSLYFSPTGGTKKVMDILTQVLKPSAQIDISISDFDYGTLRFEEDDVCFIAVPAFGGRVPAISLEHLKQMQVNGAMAIIVVVFGNRAYDDTLLELKNEAQAIGFTVAAGIAAVAQHSIFSRFGQGRPDTRDENDLLRFAHEISEYIKNGGNITEVNVLGNMPYKVYSGVPLKPKADESCTKCGICAEKCPVKAIDSNDPSATDDTKCIACMRCIAICPINSRTLDQMAVSAVAQRIEEACGSRKDNELFM